MSEEQNMPVRLVADLTLLAPDHALLVRYADAEHEVEAGWFLPWAPLVREEHPEQAVARLATEQLGLGAEAETADLDHVESFKGVDGAWWMAFHYVLEVDEPLGVTPGDRLSAAEWAHLDDLPNPSDCAHFGWALGTLDALVGAADEED